MDTAAYVAGERAAYASAFAAALPSQQALGQLFAAVETLHTRLEEDATRVRSLQMDMARTSTSLCSVSQRVDAMEQSAIPAIQRRCDQILDRPALPPEVAEALQQLQGVLAGLAVAQNQYLEAAEGHAHGAGRFALRQLKLLLSVGAGYGGALLSKADVAAVFFSRKLLVSDVMALQGGRKAKLKAGLSAALFCVFVEAAWQLHERTTAQLPRVLRRFGAPMRTGLKVVRALTWTAAFVLAVSEARRACEAAVGVEDAASASDEGLIEGGGSNITPIKPIQAQGKRPFCAGSPPPPPELMRDNAVYEGKGGKRKGGKSAAR